MKTQEIYQAFNNVYPITTTAWEAFNPLFELIHLNKNEYLVKEGSRAYYGYFLQEGLIRVFYNKDGNEYNKTFFIPGMFPTPLTALLTETPCQLNFQALLPCQLVRFPWKKFRALFAEHRCLESMMLRILEHEWTKKESHDIRMVTNDATTNYLLFREEYPGLLIWKVYRMPPNMYRIVFWHR